MFQRGVSTKSEHYASKSSLVYFLLPETPVDLHSSGPGAVSGPSVSFAAPFTRDASPPIKTAARITGLIAHVFCVCILHVTVQGTGL